MKIKIPGLVSNVGLGTAGSKTLSAITGKQPCGGCKKAAAVIDKAVTLVPANASASTSKLVIPDGYKLVLQGFLDRETQVLLLKRPEHFMTVLLRGKALSRQRSFLTEAEATADFNSRMAWQGE